MGEPWSRSRITGRPAGRGVRQVPIRILVGGVVLALALAVPPASAAFAADGASAASTGSATAAAAAGDTPAGFWNGTDSWPMPVTGSGPYAEPLIGGAYGGYIGMVGNWARWQGCGGVLAWSQANLSQAAANYSTYHKGVGTAGYWFMAGPGVDPHYNGTVSEATAWGQQQAARALYDMHGSENYPVVWMDVEIPGNAPSYTPAPDNGWNTVYTSACSGKVKSSGIPAAVDRAVLDGFASYLTAHSSYKPGVYSAPGIWASIFGTGSSAQIPGIYEWTYTADTSSLANPPSAWCLKGTSTCAQFFGGQTSASSTALMWQWSGGGGSSNGVGDFDQIDGTRTP
jgi:hypothetical protein